MAKTSPEIYQEAKTVRNETGARKNTALRVGTVLTDLAEFIGETVTVDNLRFVASQSTVEMEISRVTADGTKKKTLLKIPAATTEKAGILLPGDKQLLGHMKNLGQFTNYDALLAAAAQPTCVTVQEFVLLYGVVNNTSGPRSCVIIQQVGFNADGSGSTMQYIYWERRQYTRYVNFSSTAVTDVQIPQNSGARNLTLSGTLLQMKNAWGDNVGSGVYVPNATTSKSGFLSPEDKVKLDGLSPIQMTNYDHQSDKIVFKIVLKNGTQWFLYANAATSTTAGVMTAADKKKLDSLKGVKEAKVARSPEAVLLSITCSETPNLSMEIPAATTELAGVMLPEDKFTISHIRDLGEFSAKDSLLQASAVFNLVSDPHICLMYGAVVTEGAKNAAVIVQQVTRKADGSGVTMQYIHYGKQRFTRYVNFSATAVTDVQGIQADGSRNLTLSGNLLQMKDPWGTNVGSGVYLPAASDRASGLMTAADKKEITALRTLVDELAQRVTALENA